VPFTRSFSLVAHIVAIRVVPVALKAISTLIPLWITPVKPRPPMEAKGANVPAVVTAMVVANMASMFTTVDRTSMASTVHRTAVSTTVDWTAMASTAVATKVVKGSSSCKGSEGKYDRELHCSRCLYKKKKLVNGLLKKRFVPEAERQAV